MLDKLTIDDFRTRVGERFTLDLDGSGTLDLELTDAETHERDAGPVDASGSRSPFTIHFRGPGQPLLPQRIYRLENEALGTLELFIVPIAGDGSSTRYEAVFA